MILLMGSLVFLNDHTSARTRFHIGMLFLLPLMLCTCCAVPPCLLGSKSPSSRIALARDLIPADAKLVAYGKPFQ